MRERERETETGTETETETETERPVKGQLILHDDIHTHPYTPFPTGITFQTFIYMSRTRTSS